MADDELSAPLGQNAKKKRRRFRLPIRIPHVDRGRCSGCSCLPVAGLGADGRRPARRRAGRGRRDRLRSRQVWLTRRPCRSAHGPGGSRRSGPRSYDGPGSPAPTRRRSRPAPARSTAATARPAPRPSPSSTARPASARRSPIPDVARATSARRSSSACSKPRATAPSRASRPTAPGRPRSTPARWLRSPGTQGRPADRDRASAGSASAPTLTRQAIEKLPGAGDPRVHALRRRRRARRRPAPAPRATRCCCRRRWSRSTIPTTIPARRRC